VNYGHHCGKKYYFRHSCPYAITFETAPIAYLIKNKDNNKGNNKYNK
jgi:hypothetical protein